MGILTATIFDIQKFSIHDGPGIRTLVFFKGCSLSCLWCSNPESQVTKPELVFYPEKCVRIDKCWQICPTGAISVKDNHLAFNKDLCNLCGRCVEVCYADAWKIFGADRSVEYVMEEIEKDIPFYKESGGGVTFGGGEPLLYPDFIKSVAKLCKNKHIHTAIETAGNVSWESFEKVLNYIDVIMFDIKHMDSQKHTKFCGTSNSQILDNLEKLSKRVRVEVIVRIPVIPGFNDSEENLQNTVKFIASLGGNITGIELLPYHSFGEKKYSALGRQYVLAGMKSPDDDYMQKIKTIMEGHGINIKIGG